MASENPGLFERLNSWIKRSITLRLFTIFILILFLLIPVSMIEDIIQERKSRKRDAIEEVSSKWGREQTVNGPILTVPYKTYSKVYDADKSGRFRLVESISYAHFLPEELKIKGKVAPEKRYRGIYEVIVYNAEVLLTGTFAKPDFSDWKVNEQDILWNDAVLSLGLSDLRSIQEDITVQWDSKTYSFNPGAGPADVLATGISSKIQLFDELPATQTFSLKLNFNGSSSLQFIPLGKSTQVALESSWPDPSFSGAFLPDTRQVNADGFSATWKVLHLNRSYPQKFIGSENGIQESAFGVDLFIPVDEYQKSTRSAKYAVMFITLTFLLFFFVQVLNKVRIHPVQYIIVGLALCVFYTLLIALSEHIPFTWSYLIASVSIVSMVTLYANSIFKRRLLTRLICLILIALYVFIYSIIQMEDYALLMGSIGLFLVLATIMYLSRKLDWYAINVTGEDAG